MQIFWIRIFECVYFFTLQMLLPFILSVLKSWRENSKKIKIGLLFIIFFITIIFVIINKTFNFLVFVSSWFKLVQVMCQVGVKLVQVMCQVGSSNVSSKASSMCQVGSSNASRIRGGPYIRPQGGILISASA